MHREEDAEPEERPPFGRGGPEGNAAIAGPGTDDEDADQHAPERAPKRGDAIDADADGDDVAAPEDGDGGGQKNGGEADGFAQSLRLPIAAGEGEKRGPVGAGGVAAAVLAEGDVAVGKGGLERGEVGGAQALFAEEAVDGLSSDAGEEHAFGVDPAVTFVAGTDKNRAGGAEGDEFVGVDGEVGSRLGAGVLEVVAGHPVVFVWCGDVFDLLAVQAAVELDAAGTGGA